MLVGSGVATLPSSFPPTSSLLHYQATRIKHFDRVRVVCNSKFNHHFSVTEMGRRLKINSLVLMQLGNCQAVVRKFCTQKVVRQVLGCYQAVAVARQLQESCHEIVSQVSGRYQAVSIHLFRSQFAKSSRYMQMTKMFSLLYWKAF